MTAITSTYYGLVTTEKKSNCITNALDKTAGGARAVKDSTDGFYAAMQTSSYVLKGVQAAAGASKPVTTTLMSLSGAINVVDFLEVFSAADYIVSGRAASDCKKGFILRLVGSISFAIGTVGGVVLWFGELGFYSLSKAAAAIGRVPVLGAVASVGLLPFVCGAVALGYALYAGHAIQMLVKAENRHQVIKGCIDIVSRVANVALYILIPIPGVNLPAIIVLGIVAKGLGLVSFLYEHYNKQAFA